MSSTSSKVLTGCAFGCLALLIVVGVVGWMGYRWTQDAVATVETAALSITRVELEVARSTSPAVRKTCRSRGSREAYNALNSGDRWPTIGRTWASRTSFATWVGPGTKKRIFSLTCSPSNALSTLFAAAGCRRAAFFHPAWFRSIGDLCSGVASPGATLAPGASRRRADVGWPRARVSTAGRSCPPVPPGASRRHPPRV